MRGHKAGRMVGSWESGREEQVTGGHRGTQGDREGGEQVAPSDTK